MIAAAARSTAAARRARGLSLPRSRAGAPRRRLPGRDDRREGSVRARGARRRARRAERPAVRRAARQAGARLSRVGALGRRRRSRASSRSTCRARPTSSTPAVAAVRGELERVRADGVTADELERAQSYLDRQPPDRDAAPLGGRERDGLSRGVRPRLADAGRSYDDAIRAVTARRRRRGGADVPARPIARSPRPCGRPVATPGAAKRTKRPRRRRPRRRGATRHVVARRRTPRREREPRAPAADAAPGHGDLEASLVLIFPLLLAYEIGVLFAGRVNGADVVTRAALRARRQPHRVPARPRRASRSCSCCGSGASNAGRTLRLEVAAPVMLEAAIYALTLGALDHARRRPPARPRHHRQARSSRARRGRARGARVPARPVRGLVALLRRAHERRLAIAARARRCRRCCSRRRTTSARTASRSRCTRSRSARSPASRSARSSGTARSRTRSTRTCSTTSWSRAS